MKRNTTGGEIEITITDNNNRAANKSINGTAGMIEKRKLLCYYCYLCYKGLGCEDFRGKEKSRK